MECQLCPDGQKSLYVGESARNLFTRGGEHLDNYRNNSEKSFILKHQNRVHQGTEGEYTAKVTGRTRDCLSRQVREAVLIRRCQVPVLNSKTEWHQPALYRIQNEILRGWIKTFENGCGTKKDHFWNPTCSGWTNTPGTAGGPGGRDRTLAVKSRKNVRKITFFS